MNPATSDSSSLRHARSMVAAICRRLRRTHGRVDPPEQWPVLDELVATILSQNTSDKNSDAAFTQLRRRFPDWDAVRRAPAARIATAIRHAGLAQQKAPRIKAILEQIHAEQGKLSLEFLHDMPTEQAVEYLGRFHGVGPKTVACVLLFACRKPVLPVDTHVHRVSGRLGLIGAKTDAVRAHAELAPMVPPGQILEFHVLLIRHGRTICSARRPRCDDCPLWDLCAFGQKRLRSGGPTLTYPSNRRTSQ
jgi:endonuclease III